MDDFSEKILAEKENIEISLTNLKDAMAVENKSVIELAAIGTFLHNIYNGIENILKQVLKKINIKLLKSDTWHKELLNLSLSHGIISKELSNNLYEYLTFRHFFVHTYGFMLEEGQIDDLAKNIPKVWSKFSSEIEHHLQSVDNNSL